MKKLLLAVLALSSTTLFAQKKANDIAKLNVETYDFGKIKQSVPAVATVVVTNIGTDPLIIDQATPSCGCTISDYTKTPIAPGKTGTIKATYNAAALGKFDKTITVKFAGADDVKFIKLTGEVLAANAYDSLKENKGSAKAKQASPSKS
jgi:hypothetical protein